MSRAAALLLAALAVLSACSSSGPSPSAGPTPTLASLERAAGTKHVSNIVRAPNGYEAASWALGKPTMVGGKRFRHKETETGPIFFWRASSGSGSWTKVGTSTYPAYAAGPYACHPRIKAGFVAGDSDAVFLVYPCITGDGVLNAVAYATGVNGWGLVQLVAGGAMASFGMPTVVKGGFLDPSSEARYDMRFVGDQLQTIDGTGFLSDAGNGLFPRLTSWRWVNGRLVATSTSAFDARPAPSPDLRAPSLPAGSCPSSGTFSASFALHRDIGSAKGHWVPNAPVRLAVFPPSPGFPSVISCQQRLPALRPMTVELAHTTKNYSDRSPVSNRRWMTAPIWMLVIPSEGFSTRHRIPIPVGRQAQRTLPYVVAPSYGVNVLIGRLGDYVPGRNFKKNWGREARAFSGTVTFSAGKVVGLAVRP